jgi:hypothetical protein
MAESTHKPRWVIDDEDRYQDYIRFAKASSQANKDQVASDIAFVSVIIEYDLQQIIGDVHKTSWNLNKCKLEKDQDGNDIIFMKERQEA